MSTQQTAKTLYTSVNGINFAYRRLGQSTGTPLVMLQHFRGTMDHWDPATINRLASQRPTILMDDSGVRKIGGEVPTTYAGWADNVIALLGALGIERIDLLGFSMAGCVAQMVALNAPQLVQRLILAATCPSMGPTFV